MSFKQLEERIKFGIWLNLPKSSLVACKKNLFEQGISLQEIFSQLIVMVENKDPAVKELIQSAKTNKLANNRKEMVFTNSKSLYNALESKDPLKNKEE
jgi:ribosomal protein L17